MKRFSWEGLPGSFDGPAGAGGSLSTQERALAELLAEVVVEGRGLVSYPVPAGVVVNFGPAPEPEPEPEPEQQPGPGAGSVSGVAGLRAVGVARGRASAVMVRLVGDLLAACEAAVAARKGWDIAALSPSRLAGLRSTARQALVLEVEQALGMGTGAARVLVGVATRTDPVELGVVLAALEGGVVSWEMVAGYWRKARALPTPARVPVAVALFGDDPALAVEERLTPAGTGIAEGPFPEGLFWFALAREVLAVESADVAAERAARKARYAARQVTCQLHPEGTGTLRVSGPAVMVAAAFARLDRAARLLRGGGDERSLDQLRHDLAVGLLVHGTLPVPEGAPDDPDGISPEDLTALAAVLDGLPPVALEVITDASTLTGGAPPVCAGCATTLTNLDHDQPSGHPPGQGQLDLDDDCDERRGEAPGEGSARQSPREGPPYGPQPVPARGTARGGVGLVMGSAPFPISPGHVRELALFPGTVLHRLLTDHEDGRLIHRTRNGYRPDPEMRAQTLAADRFSRAPGSRIPAYLGELDHVTPYGQAGGITGELNLAWLNIGNHQLKTADLLRAAITPDRDLTFTTLLGQVTSTRVHDYRQHLDRTSDLTHRRTFAGQLLYAILATDPTLNTPGARLTLTHTDPATGRARPGPAASTPTPDDLTHQLDTEDDDA